jgi:N6-L-threonylcarbamoyladenine synthase
MLSGGVSANKLLRSELQKNAEQREIRYFQPSPEYTTDNAAMIALAGYFNFKEKTPRRSAGQNGWQFVRTDANSMI